MVAGRVRVAIIDYGLGNLFSVKHACETAGMEAIITSARDEILGSDAVVLPGVGAFGDAMESLRRLDLVSFLRSIASSHKPLIGICLGMQLLMTESHEFGTHKGLGIIDGPVVRFEDPTGSFGLSQDNVSRKLKVPQIGWNHVYKKGPCMGVVDGETGHDGDPWSGSLLEGLDDGVYMYFIHSFYVQPQDSSFVMSMTCYGDIGFCSSLRFGNVFAFQFHPERSGPQGLKIYGNLASIIKEGEMRRA